jgi:hypothetical protein
MLEPLGEHRERARQPEVLKRLGGSSTAIRRTSSMVARGRLDLASIATEVHR